MRNQKQIIPPEFLAKVSSWTNKLLNSSDRTSGKLADNQLSKKIKQVPFVGLSLLNQVEKNIRLITFLCDSIYFLQTEKRTKNHESMAFLHWVYKDNLIEELQFTNDEIKLFVPFFYDYKNEGGSKITKASFNEILNFFKSIINSELENSLLRSHDLDCTKRLEKYPETKSDLKKRSAFVEWIITKLWYKVKQQDTTLYQELMKVYILSISEMLKNFDKNLQDIKKDINGRECVTKK